MCVTSQREYTYTSFISFSSRKTRESMIDYYLVQIQLKCCVLKTCINWTIKSHLHSFIFILYNIQELQTTRRQTSKEQVECPRREIFSLSHIIAAETNLRYKYILKILQFHYFKYVQNTFPPKPLSIAVDGWWTALEYLYVYYLVLVYHIQSIYDRSKD